MMSDEKFNTFILSVVDDLSSASKLLAEEPGLIHVKNGIGETVLHYLAVEDQLEMVRWLYKKGSDLNTINDFGNTPLSEAASLGYFELCEFLLDNGADHRICTSQGDSALSAAATNNKTEVVKLLLARINPEEKLRNYFCPVSYDVLFDKESDSAKLIYGKGLEW